MYPLKQKILCDYDPRCIMSSGLMFDDIIMNIIRNKKLELQKEGYYCFLQILKTTSFICTASHFNNFLEKGNARVSRCSMCTFPYKNNQYETLFDQHIKKRHFKWWYEWKGRPLVGFLWKVPQEVYYYAFRIIKFFLAWREFVHNCLITTRFH